jgi:hypothetical protein
MPAECGLAGVPRRQAKLGSFGSAHFWPAPLLNRSNYCTEFQQSLSRNNCRWRHRGLRVLDICEARPIMLAGCGAQTVRRHLVGRGCGRTVGFFLFLAMGSLAGAPARAADLGHRDRFVPASLQIAVELSSASINFRQDGRPGLLSPEEPVEVRVTSFLPSWSLTAQATDLTRQSPYARIGRDRLFIRAASTQPHPDVGAGPGFIPLDSPIVIAGGPSPVSSVPLEFRLLTDWHDTPGVYEGEIRLTAVVRP